MVKETGHYAKMFKDSQGAGKCKRVTPRYVEFSKAGDTVVGRLLGLARIQSSKNEGVYLHYILDSDQGLIKFHLGAATDNELAPVLKKGAVYAFKFEGKEQLTGGRSVNKFDVVELVGEDTPLENPISVSEPTQEGPDIPF